MINSITNEYIKEELSKQKLDDNKIDKIISMFWDLDSYNSIISIDAVLRNLIDFIKVNQDFTRYEFYSYLINKETSNTSVDLVNLLRKSAVSMELLHRNELDTNNLLIIFNQFGVSDKELIDLFLSNELIFVSKNEKISFFHHSIQEFLAAQYIEEHEDSINYFKRLMFFKTEKLTAIKTSWLNVVRFLLEGKLASEILQVILDLIKEDPTNINEQFVDSIVSLDSRNFNDDQRKILFDLIFDTYLEKSIWLPVWASKNIWKIVLPESIVRIKNLFEQEIIEIKQAVNIGNAIPIIDGIIKHKPEYIENQVYWKNKFIQLAHEEIGYGVVQRRAFDALENFKGDNEVLEKIQDVMDTSKDKLVRDALVDSASKILPNAKIAIDLIMKAYQKGNSIYARYGIYRITDKQALNYLLKQLINSDKFRAKFIDDSSIFRSDEDGQESKFIKDLSIFAGDNKSLILLEKLFKISYQNPDKYYYARSSEFLPQVATIIRNNNPDFIFKLINEIKLEKCEDTIKELWDFGGVLPYFFTKENALRLAKAIKDVDPVKTYFLEKVIYALLNEKIKNGKEIFDFLEKNGYINLAKEESFQEKQEEDFYQKFLKKLEPEKGKFSLDVFEFYFTNREYLEKIIIPTDRERLKDLLINTVFEKWDTKKIEVTIQADHDKSGTGQYTITSYAKPYGDAIQLAELLLSKEELEPYRRKIINFIPFAYNDERQAILKIIDKVTSKEFTELNKIYLDKSSDKRYFVPDAYIYFVKEFTKKRCKLSSVKKVLISFIEDERIENYIRLESIEVLEGFVTKKNEEFIRGIFTKLHQSENEHLRRMGECANKILIDKFKDKESIKWRFEQIIKRATPIYIQEGIHSITPMEDELHSMQFANPIINLGNTTFIPQVLKLLDGSFEIIKKSKEAKEADYGNYVNYIWQIVIAFYEFLSKKKDIKPFLKLQKYYNKSEYKDNWFQYKLDALRNIYINEVGTPSISNIKDLINGTN